jgi:hypothetical protein
MIKYRLLPQERIFDLEDFLIFDEMNMSCKELPAEDVEGCVRYIKANAPMLDPSNSADREKLAYEVSKFFADPGRKYKQEIERLESENVKIKQEYEENLKDRNREIEELKERTKKESLRRSAWFRVGITATIFLLLEGLVIFLASLYGAGPNFFQKVVNSWPFLGIPVVLAIPIGWFIIGKERLKNLGWPVTKIFKQE